MVAIVLNSGAYSSESLIANAQRCRNLYPELNPDNTKPTVPITHYPRPGLSLLASPPAAGRGRCLYRATNGDLFALIDQALYYISPDWVLTQLGSTLIGGPNPGSMADNGKTLILVDGSPQGYQVTLDTHVMTQIVDPNFMGSTRADFIDTFLILNNPNTNQWYSTLSDQIAFDGLYIGVKTAWPDEIQCVVAIEREVWIFGPQKSEVWYNAGGVPFPFNILPGNIIEQGCAAPYSPAKMDVYVYWLSESPEGDRMAMRGSAQNVAQRISTHAIENEWKKYPRVDDAIGAVYQINGHAFYKLHFPTADTTWGFDEATQQWHEDNWIDNNGIFHRARNTFCAFAYGKNVALDWATGQLYEMSTAAVTDNGQPIVWQRSFPHLVNELKYVSYSSVTADIAGGMSVGTGEGIRFTSPWNQGFSSGFGPLGQIAAPQICMRMSKNGGYEFGTNRVLTLLGSGQYRNMMRWRGVGLARDAVFEFSSTAEMVAALNGAYVEPLAAAA